MPEVSVIVPTLNRPSFLARALASIRAQTWTDYEIIVINDGGEPVRELCRLFGEVVYLEHTATLGLPAARNTGVRKAEGRMIAYLDDDDMWLPRHLERLTWARRQTQCRLVYSDSYFWMGEERFERLLSWDYSKERLMAHNLTPVCSIANDRDLFDEAGLFDETLPAHEDYEMWLRMSDYTDFYHINEVTALYSKRPGSEQISMSPWMAEQKRYVQERYAAMAGDGRRG